MAEFPGGIYGILPSGLSQPDMLARAEAAMRGGLRLIQYRNKHQGFHRARKAGLALRRLCDQYDCRLIINDSIQLALACAADGVHLGREDIEHPDRLREQLADGMWLGVTCRADAAWAKHVLARGADYVSFGAIYGSASKPEVPVMGIPRLRKARQLFPEACLCAIGGIHGGRLAEVKACGVDAVAMISALFAGDDVEAQTRAMIEQWHALPAA